jgi:addiction module RelE/StbE family toxin
MRVFWTPRAVEDLKTIARFIHEDNRQAARRFADRIKHRAESLCRFPNRGRVLPEIGRDDVRELIEGNYRIAYRVRKDAVDILTVFEGHQLFQGFDTE